MCVRVVRTGVCVVNTVVCSKDECVRVLRTDACVSSQEPAIEREDEHGGDRRGHEPTRLGRAWSLRVGVWFWGLGT